MLNWVPTDWLIFSSEIRFKKRIWQTEIEIRPSSIDLEFVEIVFETINRNLIDNILSELN